MDKLTPIPTRKLGQTNLDVSILGLGGAPLGGLFENLSDAGAQEIMNQAIDSGIQLFDTAPWYGHGMSEHRMGRGLRSLDRQQYYLSTKVGRTYRRPANPKDHSTAPWVGGLPFELEFDYSGSGFMRSYEDSLLRLGINTVDCLVIHDLDTGYHKPGAMERHKSDLGSSGWDALAKLRQSGEISAIGAGINSADMMGYFLQNFDLDFLLVAMPYTLLDQGPLHDEFLVCQQKNVAVIVGSPYASGILATGPVEGAVYNYDVANDEILAKTRQIESVCKEFGVTLAAAAIQFPLAHPIVAAVIPGATHPSHIVSNVANLNVEIPDEFWRTLKNRELIDPDSPVPVST